MKAGRRYSYYISQATIARRQSKVVQRIPAIEMEHLVAAQVRTWLSSSLEVSKSFSALSIQELHGAIAKGHQYSQDLAGPSSDKARRILTSVLKRVVLTEAEIHIELNGTALKAELTGVSASDALHKEDGAVESVHLVAPFVVRKKGHQVRIVISAGETNQSRPIPSLIRAVARSRDWAEQIIAGKARTIDDLVRLSCLNKRYGPQIIHCAALSPQIVESILRGRQPVDLTVMSLAQNLSLDWNEQQLARLH